MDAVTRMEIRIVKYQDYIKRHPDKPYGHYCLGVLNHRAGRQAQAIACLKKALQLKEDYAPAILEWLSIMLDQGDYRAAARLYAKHRDIFRCCRIYRVRLHRLLGALYNRPGPVPEGFRGFFGWFREGTMSLRRLIGGSQPARRSGGFAALFDTDPTNPVTNIVLAIRHLRRGSDSPGAMSLYHLCHDLEGLPDNLRWDLVRRLSRALPGFMEDERILSLFDAVPDNMADPGQANRLLRHFLSTRREDSILASIRTMQAGHIAISNRNQWRFVQYCVETGRPDKSLVPCLRNLISQGWVDSVLARAASMLFEAGLLIRAGDVNRVLTLYGYGTTATG